MSEYRIKLSKRQTKFVDETEAEEVLYGGAAGGGKSYVQLVDALMYAVNYKESRQLILRRTYKELEESIIKDSYKIYPKEICHYNVSSHEYTFKNGSTIKFGYADSDSDVQQYQSAQYDTIRFDELTHFTQYVYTYMISRLRSGSNKYPKQIKSSTNPGSRGHTWVKKRFIDPAPPETLFWAPRNDDPGCTDYISRIFIPAKVTDNVFLMENDPGYVRRLLGLPESERRMLLDGDWNVFEGQYFNEFSASVHVCDPFPIPKTWRRYRSLDYGLDRFAALWIAVAPDKRVFVYREYGQSNLPISSAAEKMKDYTPKSPPEIAEEIYCTYAPPDIIHNRTQETGKQKADFFRAAGVNLVEAPDEREAGWLAIKEMLQVKNGYPTLQIFSTCRELIECLPELQRDPKRPTDCDTEPHDITHMPDALRYFCAAWWRPPKLAPDLPPVKMKWTQDMRDDYRRGSAEERKKMIERWGRPN